MVLNLQGGTRYYPATATAHGLLTAEDYALLHPTLDLQADPPRARVYLTGAQSIAHATFTALVFGAWRYDTPGALGGVIPVWGAGNPTRLTALTAGLYSLGGTVGFASSVAGTVRLVALRLNGATAINAHDTDPRGGGNTTSLNIHAEWQMAQGDYAELVAYQDTGGALNAVGGEGWIRYVCD